MGTLARRDRVSRPRVANPHLNRQAVKPKAPPAVKFTRLDYANSWLRLQP